MILQEFSATLRYKFILVFYTVFSIAISAASFYFMLYNKVSVLVFFGFSIISVLLLIRLTVIFMYPEHIVKGSVIIIRGWFGRSRKLGLDSPMEISKLQNTYIIKQNNECYHLAANVIGLKQFNRLLEVTKIIDLANP